MPSHLQMEGGFDEFSALTDSKNSGSKRSEAAEANWKEAKKQRVEIGETLESVKTYLNERRFNQEDEEHKYLKQVAEYSNMIMDESVLATMSPDSKATHLQSLKNQRKTVLGKLTERRTKED